MTLHFLNFLADTMDTTNSAGDRDARHHMLDALMLLFAAPVFGGLVAEVATHRSELAWGLLLWVVVLTAVGLLPVPVWHGLQLSLDFPVLIGLALVHPPAAAALTAFVGVSDRRELQRQIGFSRALYNRAQVAIGVLAASSAFHSLSNIHSSWASVVPAAVAAGLIFYLVNVLLVGAAASIAFRAGFVGTLRSMWIGKPTSYVANYVGLAFVGAVLAKFYVDPAIGWWSLPAVLTPLLFARQMFFRTRELEVAHEELQRAHADLQERQQVVEILSNRMAEERQDERSQVAAYLHDDVAQLLFRLSLQIDIARRRIRSGDYQLLDQELAAIRETKEKTNERVRGLIRDLDRSPLGPAGLAEALRSFTEDAGRGSGVSFALNIDDLPLPPPIQLLVYHISREAVMNALKHAGAAKISISLVSRSDHVELCLEDDGVGFDADAAPPEGHFGMTLMRERAKVAGGTFLISSTPGEGTTIRVEFPSSWLDQEQAEVDSSPTSATGALDPSVNASYKLPAPR